MASYKKRGDTWQVQVFLKGVRGSNTFRTKAEAYAWATALERDILDGANRRVPDKTFADLLQRYAEEVSTKKAGAKWEEVRLAKIIREEPIAKVKLADLDAEHFARWRDRRMAKVTAGSVLREWTLLSSVCNTAKKEWNWLAVNPLSLVKRPKKPEARFRRPHPQEIEDLAFVLGYDPEVAPLTVTARVGAAMYWAIETAMRAGEICALQWRDIDLAKRVAVVRGEDKGAGKSGRREVPLSSAALKVLELLPRSDEDARVFRMSTSQLDPLWRKGCSRAVIEDLHFHDLRAEALTRMSRKLGAMQLARVSGHKDLKILLNTYYRETAEEVALLLG